MDRRAEVVFSKYLVEQETNSMLVLIADLDEDRP